jgi:hypothetical protein
LRAAGRVSPQGRDLVSGSVILGTWISLRSKFRVPGLGFKDFTSNLAFFEEHPFHLLQYNSHAPHCHQSFAFWFHGEWEAITYLLLYHLLFTQILIMKKGQGCLPFCFYHLSSLPLLSIVRDLILFFVSSKKRKLLQVSLLWERMICREKIL